MSDLLYGRIYEFRPFRKSNRELHNHHQRKLLFELFVEQVTFIGMYQDNALIIDAKGRKRLCNAEDLKDQ